MAAVTFVHLTGSTPAREHVEELLAKLGRKERVLELPDAMPNEGPLHDIDPDGPSRAAWRKRILGAEAEELPATRVSRTGVTAGQRCARHPYASEARQRSTSSLEPGLPNAE